MRTASPLKTASHFDSSVTALTAVTNRPSFIQLTFRISPIPTDTTDDASLVTGEQNAARHDLGRRTRVRGRSGRHRARSNAIDQMADGRGRVGELHQPRAQQQLRQPVTHLSEV